ncbi:MAG: RND transporter [Hyphococcus sp.]|nr:MAG: RND transporter [Marinicaulis sp.]
MSESKNNQLDMFAAGLAKLMIKLRWLVILAAIGASIAIGSHASKLEFSNNYRAFFSAENPELLAFEEFQATYTKSDNFLFVLQPRDNSGAFTNDTLAAVEYLTEQGWQIPFALRVDSLSNFQHTYATEDDLIVEDLVSDATKLTPDELAAKQQIALAEPLLRNQLITLDAGVTAVSVVLQYPEIALTEVPEAVAAARALRADVEERFPNVDVHLTGTSMLNNAFSEAVQNDLASLVPAMFIVVLLATVIAVRSVSATAATLIIIILSSTIAMGFAGYTGVKLTGPSPMAPVIILTLAIADSIHILISMRGAMREGLEKRAAIIEATRINFLPVAVTSVTTMIGFLALNLSDSPPFRDLGTITAVGIFAAWFLSVTLLPALLSLAPIRVPQRAANSERGSLMLGFANVVIRHSRLLLVSLTALSAALIAFIPTIELSDQWREYFSPRMEFRSETDKVIEYFGFYPVEFSVPAGDSGGVSEPDYLEKLDAFTEWLRAQPNVTHVYSITDIMKRLNKNMNADDPDFYRLPGDRELSAQYLLLYELSLPYGLDLNDRINIDKSASRVTATLEGTVSTKRAREFFVEVDAWFDQNAPQYKAPPTGPQVMFTYIAQRNVESMIAGTSIAIFAIAIIMILALRSISMGLISLVPNAFPILTAFGVWAILVGEVGFSVAAIAAISLGIVIDDTVHFLTKFMRARREKGLSCADSIRYAFETVGVAIIVNTIVLGAGFLVMTLSAFKINMEMGLLTALTIGLALILDFLFLPALLLLIARFSGETVNTKGDDYVRHTYNAAA